MSSPINIQYIFLYFYILGKEASVDERKNALSYAGNYLNRTDTPWLPITVVAEGAETQAFDDAFAWTLETDM